MSIPDDVRNDILLIIANAILRETRTDGNRDALAATDRIRAWLDTQPANTERWVPLPDGDYTLAETGDEFYVSDNGEYLGVMDGDDRVVVVLSDDIRLCRCVTEPTTDAKTLEQANDYIAELEREIMDTKAHLEDCIDRSRGLRRTTEQPDASEPDWAETLWKHAPENAWNAVWGAVNPSGQTQFFPEKPAIHPDGSWALSGEKFWYYGEKINLPLGVDWRTTLRHRPEPQEPQP